MKKVKEFLTNEQELSAEWQKIVCLVLLVVCLLISFKQHSNTFLGIFSSSFSFNPALISTIVALALVCPLYLRGIMPWKKNVYTLLGSVLAILVLASFIELLKGGNGNDELYYLVALSIVLSWVGIRGIAGLSWIITIAVGSFYLIDHSDALGFFGSVYILSGFFGIALFTGLNPGELMNSFKTEYSESAQNMIGKVKSEVADVSEVSKLI